MRKYVPYAITVALFLILAARFVNLGADPPLYYTGYGQSLLTDPYHLTFAARNATLFDDWNPFDYHRWDVFQNSLVSGVAYLTFQMFGVSRISANIAALVLSCGGFLFFLAIFYVRRRFVETAVAAAFLFFNNLLFFYGRVPFLETGLIFLSGLLFYLFILFHDRWWGQILAGVLVALAAFAGKLFGSLLIVPVLFSLIYRYRAKVLLPAALTIGGAIAGVAMYVLVFYGGDFSSAISYYREHTTGMYPFPPGLTSVVAFFKMFVTYGGETGLWELAPFQLALCTMAIVVTVLNAGLWDKFQRENLPVIFCLIWVVVGFVGLSPFYYRPTRYALFLLLPLAGLVGISIQKLWFDNLRLKMRGAIWSLPVVFLSCWYATTQFRMIFARVGRKFNTGVEFMPLSALVAAALTVIVFLLLSRNRQILVSRRWSYVVVLLGVLMVGRQGTLIWQGTALPGDHLASYNKQLTEILGPEAVLTGPFMPTLTVDNDMKGLIYAFGLAEVQSDFFERYPISHVIENSNNWDHAVKEFPHLAKSQQIVQLLITSQVLSVHRVPGAKAPLTDFERGSQFLKVKMVDSALVSLERFHSEFPENMFGSAGLAMALFGDGRLVEADSTLQQLVRYHPDSYMAHSQCQGTYSRMYRTSGEQRYLELAEYHARISKGINPNRAEAY